MLADEEMSVDERRKYLKCMAKRYLAAGREGRGELLSEMEAVTGLHRKSLTRLINQGSLDRQARRGQRRPAYGHEVAEALRVIWERRDYICAERRTTALVPTAQHIARLERPPPLGETQPEPGTRRHCDDREEAPEK